MAYTKPQSNPQANNEKMKFTQETPPSKQYKRLMLAGKMAQHVSASTSGPADLRSDPRIQMVEEKRLSWLTL